MRTLRQHFALPSPRRPHRPLWCARVSTPGEHGLDSESLDALKRCFPRRAVGEIQRVDGGTQVSVWRIALEGASAPLAVRLVSRPLDLLERQATVLEAARGRARAARILAVEALEPRDGRPRCVQVTEWVAGAHPRAGDATQARAIGAELARLHLALRGHEDVLADRPLKLDSYRGYVQRLGDAGGHAQPLLEPLVRYQRSLRDWEEYCQARLARQVMHGDLHAANVLVDHDGAEFIDFDKMMIGPRVFDLAKFISTSCFMGRSRARLARSAVDELLAGYESVDQLTDIERASLRALCLILNTESALCGLDFDLPDLVQGAQAVAAWWTSSGLSKPPLRLPRLRQPAACPQQLQLAPPITHAAAG